MAKAEKQDQSGAGDDIQTICRNRRATHDYEILDRLECGLVLVGTEVKSLRAGLASLENAYARVEDGEVWLFEAEIPEYTHGNRLNHQPKRPRKLLLHRREIDRFAGQASEKGLTLVPLRLYFHNGKAKVELALAKGKKTHDKRESLRSAEARRQIERELASRRRQ